MKYLKYCVGLVAVVMLMSLVACSKKAPKNADGADSMVDQAVQAQTYGMSGQGGFTAEDGSQRHVNALNAPANQVYYFGFNQDQAQPSDLQAINIQAAYLANHPDAHVRLEGNTDDRGSREYNIGLGWRRAQTIEQVLEQQGVSPQQVAMVSYGKEHPIASGENEQAWTLNRRVELIYESK